MSEREYVHHSINTQENPINGYENVIALSIYRHRDRQMQASYAILFRTGKMMQEGQAFFSSEGEILRNRSVVLVNSALIRFSGFVKPKRSSDLKNRIQTATNSPK